MEGTSVSFPVRPLCPPHGPARARRQLTAHRVSPATALNTDSSDAQPPQEGGHLIMNPSLQMGKLRQEGSVMEPGSGQAA